MKIYIASSWKNQHAVEMLTSELRIIGFDVLSFVENQIFNKDKTKNPDLYKKSFEEWIKQPEANKCFKYDTESIIKADIIIYLSPSGKDAAAEIGIAWANKKPIYGLFAKGEDLGLMRKLINPWFYDYKMLLNALIENREKK